MSVDDRDSWWREWRQTALPVAVTLGLLALGLANVVSRLDAPSLPPAASASTAEMAELLEEFRD